MDEAKALRKVMLNLSCALALVVVASAKASGEGIVEYSRTVPSDHLNFRTDLYAAGQSQDAALSRFWADYEAAAKVARRTGRALCVTQTSLALPERMKLTADQLRFQAHAALAYGATDVTWGEAAVRCNDFNAVFAERETLLPTYGRLRCVNTHHVAGKGLDTGFFKDVRSASGSALVVGEFVGKSRRDPWRGLLVLAADDPFGTNRVAQTVTLVSRYPVDVRTSDDETGVAPDAEGKLTLSLMSGSCALVTTRLTAADIAPRMDRTRLWMSGSYLFPWPDQRKSSEQDVRNFHDLGLLSGGGNVRPGDVEKLEWARKFGINVMAREESRWFGGDGRKAGGMCETWPEERFDRTIDELLDRYDNEQIVSYDFCDEPSALDFPYCGKIAAKFVNAGVRFLPFINIYPNYASASWNSDQRQASQLGTKTYAEHVDAYCREVPLDYICFDHYPFDDDARTTLGINTIRFYDNWEDVAAAARRTGRAVYFVGQVNTKPRNVKWLTENNIRFQVSAALAYGCELYSFGTINQGWWTNSVISVRGERTEHFAKVQRIVREMKYIGVDYMRFRNVNTVLVGFENRGNHVEHSNGFFRHVRAADGSKLVVGDMVSRDEHERRRALYVFAADDMTDEKRLTREIRLVADGVVTVKGPDGPIPVVRCENGEISFKLRDCAGALVTLEY